MDNIYFISTYIGPIKDLDISDNFEKIQDANYFFFTNIDNKLIKNSSWNIITVNEDYINNLISVLDNNIVKISRAFKFYVFHYMNEIMKINMLNKTVFYCDSYLYPKSDASWIYISNKLKRKDLGIIQYIHYRANGGINADLYCIVKGKKDSIENINKTKEFLKKINKNIDLDTKQYYENTVIGFYFNEKVINLCKKFWKFYIDCPTYRDQPLWNFMFLLIKKKPIENKNFKNFFDGKKKIERNIDYYEKKLNNKNY